MGEDLDHARVLEELPVEVGGARRADEREQDGGANQYPFYDRWADAFNVSTEFVTVNQARSLASVAFLATMTSVKSQAWTAPGNVQIQANAADTGGSGLASVSFYVDGVLLETDTSSPWKITWNAKNVSKGLHVLTAVATDGAGNKTTSTAVTVTVT